MTLHLSHSLHSSPFPSPSLPLLWIHLCSSFLQRAFRPSHPFHLGRIHPYPPSLSISSTGAWGCLVLLPQAVASCEDPGETHVLRWSWAEKEPPGAAPRVSRKVLREGGVQSLTRASRSCGVYCLLFRLSLLFLCLVSHILSQDWTPLAQSLCFLLTFHGDLSINPGFTADLQQRVVLMPFTFTPLHTVTPICPPSISPSSCHQIELLSHSSYFSIFFSKFNSSGSQQNDPFNSSNPSFIYSITNTLTCEFSCIFIISSMPYINYV